MGPFVLLVLFWLEGRENFLDLFGLVEGAETTAADLHLDRPAVADQCLFVDVGLEAGLGVAVGVAHVVAAHPGL